MIKKFITFAVDKAVLNHILLLLMFIMAIFAYKSIPKEIFPPSSLDQISISGGYPGSSADILDKMAVKPMEEDLKSVDNISDITSTIRNNIFNITLDLKEGANLQLVLNDVKDVIANSKKDLPTDMNEPVAKSLVQQFPLLLIAVSGNVKKEKLLDTAKKLKSKLSNFKDLGAITIRGDADYEMKIALNSAKIEALGINKGQLFSVIASLSSIFPAGTIKEEGKKIYISTVNGEKDTKKLANTLITIGSKHLRLQDIADISYGLATPNEISTYNGQENISINVTKLKSGNAIELSKKIKALLKKFSKNYTDIHFHIYTDTTVWIKNRINLVTSNIFFGLLLVFISIFLSVNWKISLVVALGIPTSFFIGLIAANELGYSMNMLSMLGALLALGMLVDEAIVVAENIYRHLEMGESPRSAAINGTVEMFPAVLTATATTIFAFLPLLIMSGKIGVFIKILPVMISVLLLSSLFEAFYFLPLHAKELFSIKSKKASLHKPSSHWQNLYRYYRGLLLKLLRHKKLSLLLLLFGIIAGTVLLIKSSKFELFPKFDAQQIFVSGSVDVNNRLEETKKLIKPLEKRLLQKISGDDIDSITAVVGMKLNPDNTFERGEHLFHIFINLKERQPQNFFDKYINPIFSLEYDDSNMVRNQSAFEILKKTKRALSEEEKKVDKNGQPLYKDLQVYAPQTGIVKNDIEIGIIEKNGIDANKAIKRIEKELKGIDGVIAVSNNKKLGPKELKLKINSYGQQLGITEGYLINTMRGLFLEAEYGKMLGSVGIIRVKLQDNQKDTNYNLKNLQIALPNSNAKVALKDIADFIYVQTPLVFYKDNGTKIWSVTAQTTKGKATASEVMQQLQPVLQKLKKQGYEFIIKGEEKANRQVQQEMLKAAIIALFLIFISLVLMFNSLVLPLITLSVIPLSIFGALAGTKLMGLNLTMPGAMGIVGLAGVVVNDAIIMLSFIKGSKNIGEIATKATERLRPILLTSVTTILGLFTLIFFASGQALVLQPMAVSLGFGVAWATVLNLIFIPLLYATIYKVKADEKTL